MGVCRVEFGMEQVMRVSWSCRWGLLLVGMVLMAGCATPSSPETPSSEEVQAAGDRDDQDESPSTCRWDRASLPTDATDPGPTWKHYRFPGKRPNAYRQVALDGRDAMRVQADASTSMLRRNLRIPPQELHHLQFSWKVPALIEQADLTVGERSDSPVRVVLAFEGDRSKFSARDAMLSELAHMLTGEPMPYATLMYVWGNRQPAGTVVHNHRTGRIRKLVLESGPEKLGQWLDYERDIRQDFVQAFGEEPGALLAIGIMTDTDNTRSRATAWYGPVRHLAKAASADGPLPVAAAAPCAHP